ncbi:SRPBCC family protein [Protaetiibacter larvae]|uniref:SRPBCC family protein n=1 Tax=Protaetiibacter larvae TaxID=2592654 RepID=A0A5C1Y693_9MICO|nr:SRPBCC family protein [Protaetiibacter larvae]QEO09414.1 SRPBCC family protein [Protaetiibacter larvae]
MNRATEPSEHTVHVDAPPRAVFDHLRDPRNYVGLSPLVIEARDIRTDGGLLHYVAVERFRFLGFLRYDNRIAVTLRADDTDPERLVVSGDVDSPGKVQLAYAYEISPEGTGSRVVDRIAVTAPWGLRRFAAGRAGAVQLARGRILADRLAGATA